MNNVSNFTATLILFFFCFSTLLAQDLTKQGKKYLIDNQIYDFDQLGPILEADPVAFNHFLSAEQSRQQGKVNAIVSVSSLAVGIIAFAVDPEGPDPCDRSLCISTGLTILIVGALSFGAFGNSAFRKKLYARSERKKAIQHYNEGVLMGYYDNEPTIELHLGQTQNGIGVKLLF